MIINRCLLYDNTFPVINNRIKRHVLYVTARCIACSYLYIFKYLLDHHTLCVGLQMDARQIYD